MGKRFFVGFLASYIVMYILQQLDEKLANLYLVIVLVSVILIYRNEFFGNLNLLIALLKGD